MDAFGQKSRSLLKMNPGTVTMKLRAAGFFFKVAKSIHKHPQDGSMCEGLRGDGYFH